MYYSQIQKSYNNYLKLSDQEKVKYELAAVDDWLFWSRKTWVRFVFVYADNKLNRKLGRVGQESGTRYGTRNLDLIPTNKKPKSRNTNTKTVRYFDTGRALNQAGKNTAIRDASGRYTVNRGQAINGNWRSFRPNLFVIITGVWSFDKGKFVSDFSDFINKDQSSG